MGSRGDEMDRKQINGFKISELTSECRMCQPTPNAPSLPLPPSGKIAEVPGAPRAEAAGDHPLQVL